jgi:hypothetical protein
MKETSKNMSIEAATVKTQAKWFNDQFFPDDYKKKFG